MKTIDARGLKCPLPVLKAETALAAMDGGQMLVVLATDPVARIDLALLCRQQGHDCVMTEQGDHLRFVITKAG